MSKSKTELQLQQQVEKAKERLQQLQARQKQQQAQQRAAEAKKVRADDTRRKILIGAYMLAHHPDKIASTMDGYLTENRDRALFGLDSLDSRNKNDSGGESRAATEAAAPSVARGPGE